MIRYLLDTNVVSEPVKPDPSEVVLARLRERSGEVALPSVAWHELIYGATRMEEGRKRRYLLEYLRDVVRPSMPILPYDAAAARWHGRARARLEAGGRPTSFADGQIAGIAGAEGLTVVTANTSDFEPFAALSEKGTLSEEGVLEEGIGLENWFDE